MAKRKVSYPQVIGMLLDGDTIGGTDLYGDDLSRIRLLCA